MAKYLIVNGDDFGASVGVNRGIADCHLHGILTSTSMMVTGNAVAHAVELCQDLPNLSIGLHWDVCGEDDRHFDTGNLAAVKDEFQRQLDAFVASIGRLPTHVDSHRHVHREDRLFPYFRDLVEPLGIPLRGDGRVNFVGGFYAQWEWMATDLEHVSVASMQRMLREEVAEGWTEFSCHPGYISSDYTAVYLAEREAEVATLINPQVRETIGRLEIELASYRDYASWRAFRPAAAAKSV